MSSGTFEKTSIGWQLHLFEQRLKEWLELKLTRANPPNPNLPNWSLPEIWLRAAFWLIVVLFLVWLGWQLYQWLDGVRRQPRRSRPVSSRAEKSVDQLTVAGWWQRAENLQRQGNYYEACRALYLGMLQRLNDRKLVPHQASRTDGEYRQVVQNLAESQPYQFLLQTHEQLCFGDSESSPELFERCQQAYREIEHR